MNFPISNKLFEDYFFNVYQARWENLLEALRSREKQVLRVNKFFAPQNSDGLEPCGFLENCFWRSDSHVLFKNQQHYFEYYAMDPASVIVALCLEPQKGDSVLDMCAAPGGKSLVLAEQMREGELILNEISEGRRERLMRVLHEYIPKEQRLFITIKGLDANQYGLRQPEYFDKILADVPCSGERHLLENSKEFSLWTEKRTKGLAIRQYSLLSSAWLSLKEGGRIVYSTCSISPEENDRVIAKLIKKRKPKLVRLDWVENLPFVEKTEFGYSILPDKCGFGPMYFSIIEK